MFQNNPYKTEWKDVKLILKLKCSVACSQYQEASDGTSCIMDISYISLYVPRSLVCSKI
jgi:hypothetical protein